MIKTTNFSIYALVERIKPNLNILQFSEFLACIILFLMIFSGADCPNPLDDSVVKVDKAWSDATIWPNGVLPKDGDDIVIDPTWNLSIDIDATPILNSITVMGYLVFDDARVETVLKAK
jgi:hypothetical protein